MLIPLSHAGDHLLVLGMPEQRLLLTDIFSEESKPELQLKVARGDEPEASKFARIKQKIDTSPYRQDVPPDFDPVLYVSCYPDLFEHEVDPYEHFLVYGRKEQRGWR